MNVFVDGVYTLHLLCVRLMVYIEYLHASFTLLALYSFALSMAHST